ncbi:MAG: 4Fe-4S dicluster domain-containing protein [Candidatus Omnitrophica bacterium]|nr:4Fe-4S dicluster domain-containing protein [Candidatus Omnitrophota bacterium]
MISTDVLVIGAGPAGLAAAIRLKQGFKRAGKDAAVLVIDKAASPGNHCLSGAVFEPACLDELLPGWRERPDSFLSQMSPVKRDEMYFLTSRAALRVPSALVPRGMHHKGDQIVSLSRLTAWLAGVAEKEGVEIYTGLSASSLIWDGSAVRGVTLVDVGLGKDGKPKENFAKGEEVLAKVTVLADGSRGGLSREYAARLGGQQNPQAYSIGIKQILRLPKQNNFGPCRSIHTLGFPNRPDVFGGGFFYSMGPDQVTAGLVLGLDWKYTDLNPHNEFELLKTHPFVADLLKGSEVIAAGAKTIPEGGFFSLPKLWTEGALLVGDAAGFLNMEKIKGIHYAILSGMAAADAIIGGDLSAYQANLETRGVLRDMRHAKNFRAGFQWGLFAGMPLSQVQAFIPFRIGMAPDHAWTKKGVRLDRKFTPTVNRAMAASLSGTMHREDEPSHLVIADPKACERCGRDFGSPCTEFCPMEVYSRKTDGLHVSATNCVHCGTCSVKCPLQNITWNPPEGGEGPKYTMM